MRLAVQLAKLLKGFLLEMSLNSLTARLPSRNQTSLVNLKLLRNGEKVDQVVYGKDYVLRADISHPDGKHGERASGTCHC